MNTENPSEIGLSKQQEPRQVMVPLDGSPLSEVVLPHAITLARALGAELYLLRVAQPHDMIWPTYGAVPPSDTLEQLWDSEVDAAEAYVKQVAERLRAQGLTVNTEVDEGDAATAIVMCARETPRMAAIAMATHGRSGLGKWVFGSVAEKVLHASPKPLMLVCARKGIAPAGPVEPHPYSTILVPLDGSASAEQALDEARMLAEETGASIVLASAVGTRDNLEVVAEAAGLPPTATELKTRTEEGASYLEKVAARLKERMPELKLETRVMQGPPAETILKIADEVHADLIVMATHGRGGLQKMWLGSVTLKVVQDTCLPVLLVRVK